MVSNHFWSVMRDHCYLLFRLLLQGQLGCRSLLGLEKQDNPVKKMWAKIGPVTFLLQCKYYLGLVWFWFFKSL